TIYLLAGKWLKNSFRIIFGIISSMLIALLILSGLEFKIKTSQPEAERRVIICAVDVSASCGTKTGDIKNILEEEFPDYNLEIMPFSNSLRGPEGEESTAMVESLEEFLSYLSAEYSDDKIAGLAIVSDGNETEKIAALKKEFPLKGRFPHNVIYIERKSDPAALDKSVVFIDVPRFIPRYKKEKITFAVHVSGMRLDAVPVELRIDGKNLGSVLVHVENGYGEGEFDLIIKETGNFLLEASVALDSRERHTANNLDYASVEGIMKGFRVLHISGHPSTDTAFIRRGLQNIPGVDMISFYILRTHKNLMNTPNAELSLIPFPTDQLFRKELDNFDLIIVNDFLFSEFLIPTYVNNIARFVKSGGGILFMGGEQSYLVKDFFIIAFGNILPVIPSSGKNWQSKNRYKVIPMDICRLTSLSELYKLEGMSFSGLNKIKLRESANLLCRASNGSPLVAAAPAGKGRVIAVMTDSFWRASFNGGINNETLLKSFARYLLGISSMPVKIFAGEIAFEKHLVTDAMKNVKAELSFRDPSEGF
ncbi:MAG: hypothetical protein GY863_20715, partial [bacterium]|nr:hypothetical protein [bacterium]